MPPGAFRVEAQTGSVSCPPSARRLVNPLEEGRRGRGGGGRRTGAGEAEAEDELLVFPVELHELEDPGTGTLEGLAECGAERGLARGGAQVGEGGVEPRQQAAPALAQVGTRDVLVLPEELVFLEGERVEFIAQFLVLEQGFHGIRGLGPGWLRDRPAPGPVRRCGRWQRRRSGGWRCRPPSSRG